MYLHLVKLIWDRMRATHMMYVHPRFDDYDGTRVPTVKCLHGKSPVFVKDGKLERFHIRTGAATTELAASQTQEFIKQRCRG